MANWLAELPEQGWRKVLVSTSATSVAVAILAVLGTLIANRIADRPFIAVDFYISFGLAMIFTPPLFGFLAFKLQQMHVLNMQLHNIATTDFLTGALNRGAFVIEVEKRLGNAGDYRDGPHSALFVVDVDHFKSINDKFGHQSGDLALVRMADTLRATIREDDLFGRLGGEEFGIFVDDITSGDAILLAEACRIAITQCPFTPLGNEHPLSVSIGVAFAGAEDDFASLFKHADSCLYLAKSHGRNRIEANPPALAA